MTSSAHNPVSAQSRGDGSGGSSGTSDVKQPLLPEVAVYNYNEDAAESGQADRSHGDAAKCTAFQTTAALLTLQLGWGLWLLPCDFARLGWIPGFGEASLPPRHFHPEQLPVCLDGQGVTRHVCHAHMQTDRNQRADPGG